MGRKKTRRRLILFILAFIPIVISSVMVVHDEHIENEEIEVIQELKIVTEYEQAKIDIWNTCVEYGLENDFTKILAICIVETGWFKSYAYKNGHNYCGVTIKGKVQMYSTKERGLEALGITMSYYKGQTVSQMKKKYCSNPEHWEKLVNEIMKGLENENSRQISRRCESL